MAKKDFMAIALKEAFSGMRNGDGGPFGAVIVRNGKVIAKGHNQVLKTNDPTAHAEINAIREASQKLKRFDLSDCELYTTCEPCPMCLSAIYWARIKKIYFGCTRKDAEKIGFIDKFIYDAIKGKKKCIKTVKIAREKCLQSFKEWQEKENKTIY
jgi:guanine deaminase